MQSFQRNVILLHLKTYMSDFCWPVRTLSVKRADGRWQQRTPAMAAGLTDHIWSIEEWATYPARAG